VRHHIPDPATLEADITLVYKLYSKLRDPVHNRPFFNHTHERQFKTSIAYIKKGYLSDPPGMVRTEALGVLRAKQYIEKVWPGNIEIRLDNTTVVHRHNEIGENNRKRWNKVDNDIWDQMSNTRRQNCATIHVKGHADSKKKKGDIITEHEHLNITCDHIAETNVCQG
jgi:hypothetical protein